MKSSQAVKVRILGPIQIGSTLGMPGVPLKAFAQEEFCLVLLYMGGIDYIPGQDMQAALVGLELDTAGCQPGRAGQEEAADGVADTTGHHQYLGCTEGDNAHRRVGDDR